MLKFLESFFKISPDALATITITLIIFILGYVFKAIYVLIKQILERNSFRKMFVENLKGLQNNLSRQESSFLATIEAMDISKNSAWPFDKVSFFQIPIFKELSYKENFKAFLLGFENRLRFVCIIDKRKRKKAISLRRKSYSKAWQNFSLIEFLSERGMNHFFPMIKEYNGYGNQRNIAMDHLRQMWEQLLSPQNLNVVEPILGYLKALDAITSTWGKLPTKERVNPFKTQRCLILPIRILNKKFLKLDPAIFSFVTSFNDKAMQVSHQYSQMELLLRHSKYQYEEYYHAVRKIKKTNEVIIKVLE